MGAIEAEGRTIFSCKAGQPGTPSLFCYKGSRKLLLGACARLVFSRRSALAVGCGGDAAAHPFQELVDRGTLLPLPQAIDRGKDLDRTNNTQFFSGWGR
jgi:hypothetical protein